jgi:hypothetical protein
MPLKVEPVLPREARKRARTLDEYVETVLRRDLARKRRKAKKPMIELRGPIPPDIRKAKPVPLKGETKKQRAAREKLFQTILDLGGIPR